MTDVDGRVEVFEGLGARRPAVVRGSIGLGQSVFVAFDLSSERFAMWQDRPRLVVNLIDLALSGEADEEQSELDSSQCTFARIRRPRGAVAYRTGPISRRPIGALLNDGIIDRRLHIVGGPAGLLGAKAVESSRLDMVYILGFSGRFYGTRDCSQPNVEGRLDSRQSGHDRRRRCSDEHRPRDLVGPRLQPSIARI